MTYTIYHVMAGYDFVDFCCYRRSLSAKDARAMMEKIKSFKKSSGQYFVVAANKEEEFFLKMERAHNRRKIEWETRQSTKAQRWDIMEDAWRKGYRTNDAIEFLNRH